MMDEPKITAEQAADLASIQVAISEQPAAPPVPGSPGEPVKADLAAEFSGIIRLAVATLSPAFPSLNEIYTDPVREAAAAAAAAVCNKHGWMQSGVGGKWAEEIAAAAILLPLGWQTYQGVTADLEKAKPKKAAEPVPAAIEQAAADNIIQFGAPVEPVPEPQAQ